MVLTQGQIAAQMVAQLRVLDPSISAEIGTPERKIIDTTAQALAEAQVDLNLLSGALDLTAKFGSDLDAFVGLFGFGRQQGSFATGFVTFSRLTASPYNIVIPSGTQVQGVSTDNGASLSAVFQTTTAVTLVAGQTQVVAPIQALLAGAQGNFAANTINQFANLGAPPLGITGVVNEIPTSGGSEQETDAELKVRFRNTVFRNLSGTEDQFMALAVATQYSTKANVIGPISRYKEYVQIPGTPGLSVGDVGFALADDASTTDDGPGNGLALHWTTTPSNNPYAKYIYLNIPHFVTNGEAGAATLFYRQDTDFVLNAPPAIVGDTYREFNEIPSDIINPATTPYKPNVTFFNVYTGSDPEVQAPRQGDVALLEYSYMSAESRNDISRNITNCVDVYVNGENPTNATAVVPPPPGGVNLFSANPIDKFYYQNFRRIGQPDVLPVVGHIFTALFWQPVTALPDQIVVGTNTYLQGTHYWAIEDKTLLGGTVRTRNGIEWNPTLPGMSFGDLSGGPYSGVPITSTGMTSVTIAGYTYDKNIVDLQVALDGAKQVTTDVLAHRATRRYFKLDLTVVYSSGAGASATNQGIAQAFATFLGGQYFGTTIQLSDLLLVARNVSGVQNVRWSNDVVNLDDEGIASANRVTECDVAGNPRPGPIVFNTDFYLKDSELPQLAQGQLAGDTLPGLIIRPRAQNTFTFV